MGTKAGQNLEAGNTNEYTAAGDIEAYRLVKYATAEGEVEACSAIADVAIGVSTNKVAAGGRVQIQTQGVALVTVSGAVTRGAQVMCTASGAGKCLDAAGATAKSVGIAEQTATTDGQVVAVRLAVPNVNGPANT